MSKVIGALLVVMSAGCGHTIEQSAKNHSDFNRRWVAAKTTLERSAALTGSHAPRTRRAIAYATSPARYEELDDISKAFVRNWYGRLSELIDELTNEMDRALVDRRLATAATYAAIYVRLHQVWSWSAEHKWRSAPVDPQDPVYRRAINTLRRFEGLSPVVLYKGRMVEVDDRPVGTNLTRHIYLPSVDPKAWVREASARGAPVYRLVTEVRYSRETTNQVDSSGSWAKYNKSRKEGASLARQIAIIKGRLDAIPKTCGYSGGFTVRSYGWGEKNKDGDVEWTPDAAGATHRVSTTTSRSGTYRCTYSSPERADRLGDQLNVLRNALRKLPSAPKNSGKAVKRTHKYVTVDVHLSSGTWTRTVAGNRQRYGYKGPRKQVWLAVLRAINFIGFDKPAWADRYADSSNVDKRLEKLLYVQSFKLGNPNINATLGRIGSVCHACTMRALGFAAPKPDRATSSN